MPTGMLINGEWRKEGYQKDSDGRFLRNPTTFRNWIKADGSSDFLPEPRRYHLYVSLACPWAHRVLIMRKLKGLEDAISLSIVDPYMGENGWHFSEEAGTIPDLIFGANYLREIYVKADPNYTGRVTVPVLWDQKTGTIVNNESRELLRMFDHEFQDLATNQTDYCPPNLKSTIDQTIDEIYNPINNGVYRAGFAQSQVAYEEAVTELFNALNHWETVLGKQLYLCGEEITEADWCLLTTLLRFDVVYYVHFKCNLYRIIDYPNLSRYLLDLYNQPGVKSTCNFDHIKQHYYRSHPHLNPSGIVPIGPASPMQNVLKQ
ncbi:MAG: glutathione S-transferase family protein [Halothece sp.]